MIEVDKVCQELRDKYELELKKEFEQVAFFKKIQTALYYCIGGIIITNFILMMINRGNFNIFSVVGLIIFAIIGVVIVIVFVNFFSHKKLEDFQKKYNDKIGKYLLELYYSNVSIYNDDYLDYTKIYDSVNYDERYNRDQCYVQAGMKYKDKDIKLMDIDLDYVETDQNGKEDRTNIFSGIFAEIDLGFNIETRVAVTKDGLYGHGIGCKYKVEMDSKDFEDLFNVYADDKVKAMQILTADVMEIFKQMYKVSKDGFEVAIIKNKMYLRIPRYRQLFYVGMNNLIEREYINEDIQSFYLITAIIDNVDYAVKHNNVV